MTGPLLWMVVASGLVWVTLSALNGADDRLAVTLGALGPLVAAAGSWVMLVRLHARAPERVSGAMIRFFAAKMLFFGAYVAAAVTWLPAGARVFAVSFVTQYIMLHFMEAFHLHRLFAGSAPRVRVD